MSKGNVLILEDDPGIRHLFRRTLMRAGYEVEIADNTEDACALLFSQPFDLLVCDMRLPGRMTGYDLLVTLHDWIASRQLEVIAVSANEEFRAACREIGIDFFLSKPVMPTELTLLVNRLLRQADTVSTG
jgi:DNA-binding response OmpR family regulator